MKPILLVSAVLLPACAAVRATDPAGQPASVQDRDLRESLVKARLEILDLKLRLARAENKPDDELRALEEGLDSPFVEVSGAALRHLAQLPDDRRRAALPAVLQRLRSAGEAVRALSVEFLGRVAAPEAEAAVLAAAKDASAPVRRAAASALKASPSPRAVEALVALLDDADPSVRVGALDALGVAKREAAVGPLIALLGRESDPKIVEKAVDALGAIGSAAAVEPLLTLLEKESRPEVRWSCINSLGRIGDPRAAPRLRAFLAPQRRLESRQITIEALGKLRDAEAVPLLEKILREDPNATLRERAAAAIGLMSTATTLESVLVPAYVEEKDEAVRRAIWTSMTTAAGERFEPNERLVLALLGRDRRGEADQVCARMHAIKPEEGLRVRAVALEERVAEACREAGDAKAALAHYRQLEALAPERTDVPRRIAACYRELKDLESALKSLRALDARLPRTDPAAWDVKLDILAALESQKDPEPLVDEAHALLSAPVPEERRKAVEQAMRTGALRMAQAWSEADETGRPAALEALKRAGKKIVPVLAGELEAGRESLAAVLEAGATITQIRPNGEPPDAAKLKDLAAAWRQWAAKP